MRIAIVDDAENWRECIRDALLRLDTERKMEIDLFTSGEEYLDSETKYDISLIDIEMSGMSGFETIPKAREHNPDGIYMILTTHVEMSRVGYQVNAFRYIDKTQLEELDEAMKSAEILLQRNRKITVDVIGDGPRQLALKNIIYVETEKHYVLIHLRQMTIKCKNSMQEIESMLPDNCFVRCHKVYIVNLDEIKYMRNGILYLSNDKDIDVSKRKRMQFKKQYLSRQCECANK